MTCPPTVLVLIAWYLPGYRGGGPIRSVAGLVEHLSEHLNFKIVTQDRDLGTRQAYSSVEVDHWQNVGGASVFYASPGSLSWHGLRRLLNETHYDILYLNSLFSPVFTVRPLVLRRLGLIPKTPTIVAPRGELSPGALRIKRSKKRLFTAISRATHLYGDVIWHASTKYEVEDINRYFSGSISKDLCTLEARDLTTFSPGQIARPKKEPGRLRVMFLSRITAKKNLRGAIHLLAAVPGSIEFSIYGPIEDAAYWRECQAHIAKLPANVRVRYEGELPHSDVSDAFATHDLFFLPTLGENFGHVVVEALSAGCPVLISDQTAWRGLEATGAGWDLPLTDEQQFINVLTQCVEMDAPTHSKMAGAAMQLARTMLNDDNALIRNRELFERALRHATNPVE